MAEVKSLVGRIATSYKLIYLKACGKEPLHKSGEGGAYIRVLGCKVYLDLTNKAITKQ